MNSRKALAGFAVLASFALGCGPTPGDDADDEELASTSDALGTPINVDAFQIMNGSGRALNPWNNVHTNNNAYHELQETNQGDAGVHLSARYQFTVPNSPGAGYQLKISGLVPYHTTEKFVVYHQGGPTGPKILFKGPGGCEFDGSVEEQCVGNIYTYKNTKIWVYVEDDPNQPTDGVRDDVWIDQVLLTPL